MVARAGYAAGSFDDWIATLESKSGNVAPDSLFTKRLELFRIQNARKLNLDFIRSNPVRVADFVDSGDAFIWLQLSEVLGIGTSVHYSALFRKILDCSQCRRAVETMAGELSGADAKTQEEFFWELSRSLRLTAFPLQGLARAFRSGALNASHLSQALALSGSEANRQAAVNAALLLAELGRDSVLDSAGDYSRLLGEVLHAPANFDDPTKRYRVLASFLTMGGQIGLVDSGFLLELFLLKDLPKTLLKARLSALYDYRKLAGKPLVGDFWDVVFEEAFKHLPSDHFASAWNLISAMEGRPTPDPEALAGVVLAILELQSKIEAKVIQYRRILGRVYSPRKVLRLLYQDRDPEIQAAIEDGVRDTVLPNFREYLNAVVKE